MGLGPRQFGQYAMTGTSSNTRSDLAQAVFSLASSNAELSERLPTPDSAPIRRWMDVTPVAPSLTISSSATSMMLSAMESSCMMLAMFGECCQCRLPQANPAIVGRDDVIHPDAQVFPVEKRLDFVQQQVILKHAPGEHEGVRTFT